eukprot:1733749-Rhodomonas_salina.2
MAWQAWVQSKLKEGANSNTQVSSRTGILVPICTYFTRRLASVRNCSSPTLDPFRTCVSPTRVVPGPAHTRRWPRVPMRTRSVAPR